MITLNTQIEPGFDAESVRFACDARGTAVGTAGVAGTVAKPELLAPAGDHDAFLAALSAGADAIYLGVEDFNARRNAKNFSLDTLGDLCDLAHIAGRRIYLTLNTMILPGEISEALRVAHGAWDAGVDALIVQDLGLLARLSYEMPGLELHASTQMNIHSAEGVRFAARLGASRVTLARELALDEIAAIAQEGVELEVFAHGALCICYSGQCLFSSLVGRRSANRGLCAQACRLPYQLIDTSTGKRMKTPGEHLLSPADLATIDILPALCATGVSSLKIEGRMKSAAYVAAVTRAYREALDALVDGDAGTENVDKGTVPLSTVDKGTVPLSTIVDTAEDAGAVPASCTAPPPHPALDALAETFSRGFTTGYLTGERGNALMSYTRPNNRGVAVGRVGALNGGLVGIDLTKSVARGDALELRTSRGRSVVTLADFWASASENGAALEKAAENTRIYLRVPTPVGIGDRVFRVRNARLQDDVATTFDNTVFQSNNGLVSVDARVVARLGQELEISFATEGDEQEVSGSFGTGVGSASRIPLDAEPLPAQTPGTRRATARGAVVETARTKAVTVEDIREHVGRVGSTPFSIRSWDIQLDEGVGLGFSALHKLRAEALEELTATLLAPWRTRELPPREQPPALAPARKGAPRVAALVCDAAGAKAAKLGGAELIYLHSLRFEATGETESPTAGKLTSQLPTTVVLPAIAHEQDLSAIQEAARQTPAVVVNNLGEFELLKDADCTLEAGASLGICNGDALALLARHNLAQAWLSPELSYQDITLIAPTSPVPLALTIYGQQEVMVTEHCLLMAQGPCDQRCTTCARRKAPRLLEDRKGYRLPVRTDDAGRSHLYNAIPLDLSPSMPELVSLGISTFVVDGTLLTTKKLRAEVERAVRARDLAVKGAGSLPKREGHTTGHFFRGVY